MSGRLRRPLHTMWISKPVYESLPYFYLAVGAVSLMAAMYVNHGYWPTICFAMGFLCLTGGLVVLLKRRDARIGSRRKNNRGASP